MSSGDPRRAELHDRLVQELRKASARSVMLSQAVAERLGMNPTDLECLDVMSWIGPLTAGRLAEATGLTTGAITGVIDRLEKAGFVRREMDPADRRRVIVQLQPLSDMLEQKVGSLFAPILETTQELASHYSDEELAVIVDFIIRANAATHTATLRLRAEPGRTELPGDFSAPLAGVTHGRLEFASGADKVSLQSDPALTGDLYRAHFTGPAPTIQVKDGTITIHYRLSLSPKSWRGRSAEVRLNASIPWEIAIRGGTSNVQADLSGLNLSALELSGGASHVTISLPMPIGTVPVRVSGGASDITIHRPSAAPARVQIGQGASKVVLDHNRFGAIGGETRWESSGFTDATNRYDIRITGGASKITIDTR